MKKIVVLFLLFTSFIAASQEVLLKLHQKKGDNFVLKADIQQTIENLGSMIMKFDLSMSTTNANENEITTKSKVNKIVVDINQGGAITRYDSSSKKRQTSEMGMFFAQQYEPVLKSQIITTKNRFGVVKKMEVLPPNKSASMINMQFSYPEKPVKVGSSWESRVDNPAAGSILLTYTVSKITKTIVHATIKGRSSNLKTMKLSGEIDIDIATGNPLRIESKTSLKTSQGKVTGKSKMTLIKI